MDWIRYLLGKPTARPQADREAFERREAQLRDRYERLARLATEADVIQRSERPEDQPWAEQ